MFDEMQRRNPNGERRNVVLVDGDEDQLDNIEAQATKRDMPITVVLDLIHVIHYLFTIGQLLCASDAKATDAWVAYILAQLLTRHPLDVIATIRQTATLRSVSTGSRVTLDAAVAYLHKNSTPIDYATFLRQGLPIATEWLANDPLFEHLAGGAVPSVDVLYDDLRRFGPDELEQLEAVVADHGLRLLRERRPERVTVDVDTTVMPLFGHQEGALPGSNPRYHGRPSYHPILARTAETDTVFGARLRPGDTSLGEADVEDVEQWLDRAREAAGPKAVITVRIDAGGDCAALLAAIDNRKALFVVKAKQTPNLLGAATQLTRWHTVDFDADGVPSRQAAELDFQREAGHRGVTA